MSRIAATPILILSVLVANADAQWLDHSTPGVPRLADGKPDLNASPPRTVDGKSDLSGLWQGPGISPV